MDSVSLFRHATYQLVVDVRVATDDDRYCTEGIAIRNDAIDYIGGGAIVRSLMVDVDIGEDMDMVDVVDMDADGSVDVVAKSDLQCVLEGFRCWMESIVIVCVTRAMCAGVDIASGRESEQICKRGD